MSLRSLHVIPSVAPCRGGPSKAVVEMVCALNTYGVEAEIVTTNDACQDQINVTLTKLIDYRGAPTRFFDRFSSSISAVREFQFSHDFMRWLRNHIHDYDLIHVHAIFSFCSSYAMWLARRENVPYIVRPIGQLENWALAQAAAKKNLYLLLIERKNLLGAKRVHFTAHSECEQALGKLPTLRPAIIPLGVNLPPIIPDAPLLLRERLQINLDQPVIAFVSRLHHKKGLELLFDALANLTNLPFTLVVAGEGEANYKRQLVSHVAQLGLQERVKWIGFAAGETKNLVLQGANLFALTSYSENFGIAVLEALASGTPALVTREVALATEIEQAGLGYVADITIESITQSLAIALNEIINAPQNAEAMSERVRSYAENHFQWSAIAARLDNVYREIAD